MPKHIHRKCLDLNCPIRLKKLKYSLEHIRFGKFKKGIHKDCKNYDACDCPKCEKALQEMITKKRE